MADTVVLVYDALDPILSHFSPQLTKRLLAFAEERYTEGDPRLHTQHMLARLAAAEQNTLCLIVVNPTTAQLVGHCLATLEQQGAKKWAFVWQLQVDGKQDGVVDEVIRLGCDWARGKGATNAVMCTDREKGFAKRYKFTARRVLMTLPIEEV